MIISFVLITLAISIWSIYLIADWNDFALSPEFLTVLIGVAFFSMIISLANSVWCGLKISDKTRRQSIIGLILSLISITLFILYVVMRFVVRAHDAGLAVF